jgi:hypothetical protein
LTKCDARWKTDAAAFKMLDALDAAQRHTDKTAIDVPKGASAHERMALAMNPFLTKLKRTCGPGRIWFRRHGAFTAVLAQEAGCLLLPNPAETNDAPSEIASEHTHDSSEQAS